MVKSFNQVAVIGAGTMGHGLALNFALGGSRVCLVDVGRDCLDRAMELIRSHLRGLELQQQFDIAMDEEVADPVDIDRAAKASLAIRLPVMGVVARYDFAGLDATLNNLKGEPIHLASGEDRSLALEHLVDQSHHGVKTGRGFFDWSRRDLAELLRERDLLSPVMQ